MRRSLGEGSLGDEEEENASPVVTRRSNAGLDGGQQLDEEAGGGVGKQRDVKGMRLALVQAMRNVAKYQQQQQGAGNNRSDDDDDTSSGRESPGPLLLENTIGNDTTRATLAGGADTPQATTRVRPRVEISTQSPTEAEAQYQDTAGERRPLQQQRSQQRLGVTIKAAFPPATRSNAGAVSRKRPPNEDSFGPGKPGGSAHATAGLVNCSRVCARR